MDTRGEVAHTSERSTCPMSVSCRDWSETRISGLEKPADLHLIEVDDSSVWFCAKRD